MGKTSNRFQKEGGNWCKTNKTQSLVELSKLWFLVHCTTQWNIPFTRLRDTFFSLTYKAVQGLVSGVQLHLTGMGCGECVSEIGRQVTLLANPPTSLWRNLKYSWFSSLPPPGLLIQQLPHIILVIFSVLQHKSLTRSYFLSKSLSDLPWNYLWFIMMRHSWTWHT